MKKNILTYILFSLFSFLCAVAQNNTLGTLNNDMRNRDANGNQIDPSKRLNDLQDSVEIKSLPPTIYMWRISPDLGTQILVPADTLALNFQNSNLVGGPQGQYNYLGNLGSPRLSRIFSNRSEMDLSPTIFMNPFGFFYFRPDQFLFTNSNVPYTNLTYHKMGNKLTGEDHFKSYFSVNVNKRFAFGFNFDYQYGRGYYNDQSTSLFNGGVFASYMGKHYQMHAMYNNFYVKMNENGGISDDGYITHPENMAEEYKSNEIPTNLTSASNRNHDMYVFLNQRYRLGFDRVRIDSVRNTKGELKLDTIESYVPVTSFIHTMKIERSRHSFEGSSESAYTFDNTYFSDTESRDSTIALSIQNTVGIALLEGFNKYAKAGITAFLTHKVSKYQLMNNDTTLLNPSKMNYTEHEVYIGGELAKRQGNALHYNLNGRFGLGGIAKGDYKLSADADLNLSLFNDTLSLIGRGSISNSLPSFYMRHYHSNHYLWDFENSEKELRTKIEGEMKLKRFGTNLKLGVYSIKNYTYFNDKGIPTQASDAINVTEAVLSQNFHFGVLHLDNNVTWQKSSNEEVLPLPDFSLYHNLYLLGKVAKKVLTVQIGADVRYFTKYYAPSYNPYIQQFQLQTSNVADQIEISGYPIVNVYANFHLKRTRFYVMMYHINAGSGSKNAFLVPHYPINPKGIKFGLSWNFYD